MRYFYKLKSEKPVYGVRYVCDHPLYNSCTLYQVNGAGLAVIFQRFTKETKCTYWAELPPSLANDIFKNPGFIPYFLKRASPPKDGLYPTVSARQIMWALRMKPLKKERWETVFDRKDI